MIVHLYVIVQRLNDKIHFGGRDCTIEVCQHYARAVTETLCVAAFSRGYLWFMAMYSPRLFTCPADRDWAIVKSAVACIHTLKCWPRLPRTSLRGAGALHRTGALAWVIGALCCTGKLKRLCLLIMRKVHCDPEKMWHSLSDCNSVKCLPITVIFTLSQPEIKVENMHCI